MSAAPSVPKPSVPEPSRSFGFAGGEVAALIRTRDWGTTPLGPMPHWPQSLRTVVETMLGSRYAMWLGWGADLTFFYNDAYRPTLGVKHPWALGASAREVWREIWPTIGPRIDHVLATGEATYDEGLQLMLERSGFPEETFHTFSYSPVPDGAGGVGGMLCVVTEDTRRVIGERRLALLRDLAATTAGIRSSEAYFRTVADFLGDGMPDLPITLFYLLDQLGQSVRIAGTVGLAPDHPAAAADGACWPLAGILAGGGPHVVDGTLCGELPNGPWDRPPARVVLFPIAQQGHASPAGVIVAGINPYRPFDDDYRGFMELFAGQIAAGLANARAYEEERRRAEALTEIDRAKTTFFSNVSHEFRTPLTLMLSPVEELLARPDALPPEQNALLETAQRNGLRLLRLVNALLDFSRVEAGRTQASFEPVDLAAFTADLAGNFRSACERAGLALDVDCPPLPPGATAFVDRDMWEKIVLNLLSNAFKFTLQGGITVRLRAGDGVVRLTVADSGIGIPHAELPLLFERFHRVEGARGRTMEGSGIGLALVQELVRLHGGDIAVASTPDEGSAFTITLPLGSAHLPQDRIGAARNLASTATRADAFVEEALRWLPEDGQVSVAPAPRAGEQGRARVLLADDNTDMRDYIGRLLAAHYDVEAVADGGAALQAARAHPPDLVLTDVMMPVLDGFALLRGLREDRATREVPVIMLSARAGEEARIEGLDAGADDYLAKPFSARELLARVRANLDLARSRRAANAEVAAWRDRYEAAVHAAGHLLFDWDVDDNTLVFGTEAEPFTGYDAPALSDVTSWMRIVHPADQAKLADEIARARAAGDRLRVDYRLIRKDGRVIDVEVEGQFVRSLGDAGRHVVGFLRDVTEQRRAIAHQRLLLDELNHRVKNTLAAVQSIAQQTLRGSGTVEQLGAIFVDRLMGLSKTHNLLTAARWEGASLSDVALGELALFQDASGTRVELEGDDIRLGPKPALALGMAIHELATNAAKYGALSAPTGRLRLRWDVRPNGDGRVLHLVWQESGGPPVRQPERRGFGSRLIERGLARELRGTVELLFAPPGVICVIEFPLTSIEVAA